MATIRCLHAARNSGDLYREWKEKLVEVDLAKLWRELGIEKNGDEIKFHDEAPLAAIRKAITSKH